ncbi:MAG: hypothetical protein OXB89_00685 [Anaerolineaceae bacterium]|nr:hypothetical protein [Anaerolineaceae bacterium]
MSSIIDRETFQRLTLLYLIAQFPEGVDNDRHLQKVLYLATRDVEPKPFTFHYTEEGPFSRDASVRLLHMFETAIVQRVAGNGTDQGDRWMAWDTSSCREFCDAYDEGLPLHADALRDCVARFGCLKPWQLDALLGEDPLLQGLRGGRVLMRETKQRPVRVALDDDLAEELDMMLNPEFLQAMERLDRAVAKGRFDTSKVRKIRSLDHLV